MESILRSKYGELKLVRIKLVYQHCSPHSCWNHHMLGYLVQLSEGLRTDFGERVWHLQEGNVR